MKYVVLGTLFMAAAGGALADSNQYVFPPDMARKLVQHCGNCATVQEVRKERRGSESGRRGIVAFASDEIQQLLTGKDVWVTRVRQRDGSERSFEQEHEPNWRPGTIVRIKRNKLVNL